MKWKSARVGVPGAGPGEQTGQLAVCPECNGSMWALFRIGGHPDVFGQCVRCRCVFRVDEAAPARLYTFEPVPASAEETVHPFADQEGG